MSKSWCIKTNKVTIKQLIEKVHFSRYEHVHLKSPTAWQAQKHKNHIFLNISCLQWCWKFIHHRNLLSMDKRYEGDNLSQILLESWKKWNVTFLHIFIPRVPSNELIWSYMKFSHSPCYSGCPHNKCHVVHVYRKSKIDKIVTGTEKAFLLQNNPSNYQNVFLFENEMSWSYLSMYFYEAEKFLW